MLYAYDKVLIADAQTNGDLTLSTNHEHLYISPEDDRVEMNGAVMNGAVIYEGKDIKAWAKKQNFTYPQAMTMFRPVFFGDNGKEYFIRK